MLKNPMRLLPPPYTDPDAVYVFRPRILYTYLTALAILGLTAAGLMTYIAVYGA